MRACKNMKTFLLCHFVFNLTFKVLICTVGLFAASCNVILSTKFQVPLNQMLKSRLHTIITWPVSGGGEV